jgi:hypothetical protein
MKNNGGLFNAAEIGENPDTAFNVEGNHLHAVDQSIADRQKDKSDPRQVLPLMREALKALIQYAQGKVESHFLEIDWKIIEGKEDEQKQLIHKIQNIYTHLPHHDRNELSSLVHHKQANARKR